MDRSRTRDLEMEQLNDERIEKRIQELGLDKDEQQSYDIARDSLDMDSYGYDDDNSNLSNPQTRGLWLGGMDRTRTRDLEVEQLNDERIEMRIQELGLNEDDQGSVDMDSYAIQTSSSDSDDSDDNGDGQNTRLGLLIQDRATLLVPSLRELTLKVLAKYADHMVSLKLVPYFLRKKLIDRLCDTSKMNAYALNLLIQGCPTEVRVKNCSWLTDGQFQQSLQSWETENLRVLQLDLGGQIMFDFALRAKLDQSPDSFFMLAVLSLRGASHLTDTGVELIVKSAPTLVSVNLGLCCLVTCEAVNSIADNLGEHLRELYIDGCDNIKAMQVEDSIIKFRMLEVFSVARLEDVSDGFIQLLVTICGESLKDLDVAHCLKLTDLSLKAVAIHCPGLFALNISSLHQVTDVGLECLANGCRSIQRLNLKRTKFSDEVVAAFIETSGESLTELTLNHIVQVGLNTALSLARNACYLSYLDISFCRRIRTNSLGMIIDSCLSLKLLKVFGCSQISSESANSVLLHGHTYNPQLRVIGFDSMPILDHINLLEPDHEVYLRYSPLLIPIDP